MLTLKPKTGTVLIAVYDEAIFGDFRVGKTVKTKKFLFANGGYNGNQWELPPGEWKYIGTSREITEEQAAAIVERVPGGYKNYEGWLGKDTAIESLFSLISSEGGDPEGNVYALIQNI